MSGDLTVDTNTLKVDSTNNRVGIGTVNPNFPLQLDSNRADATFDANDVSTWSDFKIQGQTAVGNARGIYFDFDQDTGNDRGSGIVGISQDGTGGVGELGFITTSGNNSQERVRIDRNGQISIAGNTPSFDTTGAKNGLQLYYETDTGLATIGSYSSGGTTSLTFHTNASGNASTEKMRIDSSGNLLVGKTFSNISTVGVEFRPEGLGIFGRDGNTALTVNRKTSDGKIISVRKDNTEIGSIGVHNTRITIGNQDTGLKFNSGIDSIFPFDLSIEANRDNAVDLGWGSARFRDLYLGGGLYVGGTGTANKLDDYEEGTWSPSITTGTANFGTSYYTKIGRQVTISFNVENLSDNTTGSSLEIGNLPFTNIGTFEFSGSCHGERVSSTFQALVPFLVHSTNKVKFRVPGGTTNFITLNHDDVNDAFDFAMRVTMTYFTD